MHILFFNCCNFVNAQVSTVIVHTLSLSPRGLLYYYLEATNVGIEVGNLCVYCKCSLSAKKI